jgi:aspartyl-tRNA(Asn)/glutamyl-tRNA(Gln) amidotransferase subunit A
VTDLTKLTISEARAKLAAKEITAVDLTDAHIAAIEGARALNAFVTETPEKAREMAKASDARIAAGKAGPLEGIPLAVKDLFCTDGIKTTASSKILGNFVPSYESTVTQNLWNDGAVLLGKVSCDEFAMGGSNETSAFGPVVNPWRRKSADGAEDATKLVPGGSSGGSAAAVAANLCLGSAGTDTGGSIRQPAAFTGIVGIKPTYGRCSRWGVVAYASSLDQAGPFAKTVRDAAILLKSFASVDAKDTTSVDAPVPDYEAAIGKSVKGLTMGTRRRSRRCGIRALNG